MAVWRCPHCATPQPESSRCWVCRRSTTSCATCRHFRRGVAGGLGWCGLDTRHPALTGLEMRACWVAAAVPEAGAGELVPVGPGHDPVRPRRTFVPVDGDGTGAPVPPNGERPAALPGVAAVGVAGSGAQPGAALSGGARRVPGAWWLWGDPDPWPER